MSTRRHPSLRGRARGRHIGEGFLFPQIDLGDTFTYAWSPGFLDYLSLAFNPSTAFSSTDNAILSRRAKVLMMQELHLLLIFAVLVSQAINALAAA